MYLYGFNKYAWVDKVWKTDWDFKSWDLLKVWEDFYLSLSSEVSFSEQYVYSLKSDISKTQIIEKKLLNKQTLKLLHRMVYQRYSTYKNVIKLFLPQEIEKLIDKKITKRNKKNNNTSQNVLPQTPSKGTASNYKYSFPLEGMLLAELGGVKTENWQTLIVFPDLRTLINLTTSDFREQSWVDTLLSTNTQNQKDKSRRNIKNGNTQVILATHSEIFQNYKDLQKIIIIRPHKRYYSNQQDPRYKTLQVVKKLSEIWDCELEIIH